jgi:hypothetical protein
MIKRAHLKFGASSSATPLSFDVATVTIFVGPNNSGKSRALTEIANFCQQGHLAESSLVIRELTFPSSSEVSGEELLSRFSVNPRPGENMSPGHTLISLRGNRFWVNSALFVQAMNNPNAHRNAYTNSWLRHQIIILDGLNRIKLTATQNRGDLLNPTSSFARLFVQDPK